MLYKNISSVTKTFYGVVFKPGAIKEVPGYINDPKFVVQKEAPKQVNKSSRRSSNSKRDETDASGVVEVNSGETDSKLHIDDAIESPLPGADISNFLERVENRDGSDSNK